MLRSKLKAIAEAKGWDFVGARRDYANLYQAHQLVNDAVEGVDVDKSVLILDPVKFNRTSSSEVSYTGSFMILTRSDLKKTYEQKLALYIDPITDYVKTTLPDALRCDFDIVSWSCIEVVNELDLNGDGYAVTFNLKAYE